MADDISSNSSRRRAPRSQTRQKLCGRRTRPRLGRENAQHSTVPSTDDGKAISSKNRLKHGFCGQFIVLASESQDAFDNLLQDLREHEPTTPTENIPIDGLAQHYWLSQRAQIMQEMVMLEEGRTPAERERYFSLYLRYQTTNKRAFSKCLHDLLKLRAARLKEQQVALDEARKQETHAARLRTVNARAALQTLQAERRRRTENHPAPPDKDTIPFVAAHNPNLTMRATNSNRDSKEV